VLLHEGQLSFMCNISEFTFVNYECKVLLDSLNMRQVTERSVMNHYIYIFHVPIFVRFSIGATFLCIFE